MTDVPAGLAWRFVSMLTLAGAFSYTDRQMLSLLIDPIRHDLNLTDTDLGILQGAVFAVVYAVAALPVGLAVDRYSRKAILVSGIILWSLGTMACGLAGDFTHLAAARLAVGIGEATLGPAATSIIADLFPDERRSAPIAILLSGFMVGGGLAVLIGGHLLGAAQAGAFSHIAALQTMSPWRQVFLLAGMPGFFIAALILPMGEPERRAAGNAVLDRGRIVLIREITSGNRLYLRLCLSLACLGIGDFAFASWMPALLSRRFAYSADEIASSLGWLSMAASVVGTLGGGAVSGYLHRKFKGTRRIEFTLVCALLGGLAASLILLLPQSGGLVLSCFAIWMLASSSASVSGFSALVQALPSEIRGLGIAFYSFLYIILAMSLGPLLVALGRTQVFIGSNSLSRSIAVVAIACALITAALLLSCRQTNSPSR